MKKRCQTKYKKVTSFVWPQYDLHIIYVKPNTKSHSSGSMKGDLVSYEGAHFIKIHERCGIGLSLFKFTTHQMMCWFGGGECHSADNTKCEQHLHV